MVEEFEENNDGCKSIDNGIEDVDDFDFQSKLMEVKDEDEVSELNF